MNRLVRVVALVCLSGLLSSCSMLQGPMRTVQSAFRTISDATDHSQTPPMLEAPTPLPSRA